MIEKLEEFFSDVHQYQHYSGIMPRPDEYNNWTTDKSIRRKYADWITQHSNCPSLKLDIEFPHQEVLSEVLRIQDRFVKHRGSMHPGWCSMCIHGVNTETTNDWRAEEYSFSEKPVMDWCDIADDCPTTKQWLSDVWPAESFDRVRFMLLEPGGYIQPHQDYDTRSLSAVNIAVNNPAGCMFGMEEAGEIPWQPGDVRAIDIGRRHSVWNTSTQNRIHIIIHSNHNPEYFELLCRSYDRLLKSLK